MERTGDVSDFENVSKAADPLRILCKQSLSITKKELNRERSGEQQCTSATRLSLGHFGDFHWV